MTRKLYATPELKIWREEKGWNQPFTAEYLSVSTSLKISPSRYQKIERGVYAVTAEEAAHISNVVKRSMMKLWREQETTRTGAEISK